MKLTDEEVKTLAQQVNDAWNLNNSCFFYTFCTKCHERRKCITRVATGESICSSCYLKERIEEKEQERLNLDLKDFARL